jgi:hypothetical protein
MLQKPKLAYTLKQGNKTLGLNCAVKDVHYIVGFRNVTHARYVQYTMHPSPKLVLKRGFYLDRVQSVDDDNQNVVLDHEASLYIPKAEHTGGPHNPLNDGGWHLNVTQLNDLISIPVKNHVGLLLVSDTKSDTRTDIELSCCIIEPIMLY